VLGSQRCDCGEQLRASLRIISERGRGVIVYVAGHEGRGIGLVDKLRAYRAMQLDHEMDTYAANEAMGLPADARRYDTPLAVLDDLRVRTIELLTNNPEKMRALGRRVVSVTPLECAPNPHNERYIRAKRKRETEQRERLGIDATPPLQGCCEGSAQPQLSLPHPSSNLPRSHVRVAVVKQMCGERYVDSLFAASVVQLVAMGVERCGIVEEVAPDIWDMPLMAKV
jgi:GTP cyclohydrolase II